MLAGVVLVRLGHAHRGIARLLHRRLVAASAEAVSPHDLAHVEVWHIALRDPRHEAGEVAGRCVKLTAVTPPDAGLQRGLVGARPFGEHSHRLVCYKAVHPVCVADDVIVQHRLNLPALRLREVGEHLAAVKPLLLAGEYGVDDGGGEALLGKHPRRLDHCRRARAVVVGAGGVAGEVGDVGDAAVDVARDDHHPVGI